MERLISFNKGDKVRIKSRQWYLDNRDYDGFVNFHRGDDFAFSPYTAKYCGYIFEIACKIGITKGGNNIYLLKYADGYFTEDMFDAVPSIAPLTINSENIFAVKDKIEKDKKWFESEPLPVAPTNVVKTSPFFRRYKEIDFFAFEWVKATLENKYKNYKPIGLLRPFTIPNSKLEISDTGGTTQYFQRDYLKIPDYALSRGEDIMALYIVVWRGQNGEELFSVCLLEYPKDKGGYWNPVQEYWLCPADKDKLATFERVMHYAKCATRGYFRGDMWTHEGILIQNLCGKIAKIKPLEWYNTLKDEYGRVVLNGKDGEFTHFMAEYCGCEMKISSQETHNQYILDGGGQFWFPDWCFDIVKGESIKNPNNQYQTTSITNLSRTNCLNSAQMTYLMRDENTGCTKIGKSVNPRVRERTLLSDKPTITLLVVCEKDVEKELHAKYADKRVRGEWFNLTEEDIMYICRNYNFTKYDK